MQGDDPPYLSVGTEVSAKYKGAFCEAKVRKVVKNIKCKASSGSAYLREPLFKHPVVSVGYVQTWAWDCLVV